jgi:hypothetical protein
MTGDPFYSSRDWYKAKAKVKARDFGKPCPLCKQVMERNQSVSVDHEPMRKRLHPSMWCDMSVLQLVHRQCHDSIKQSMEANSHKPSIGSDGFPVDGGWA